MPLGTVLRDGPLIPNLSHWAWTLEQVGRTLTGRGQEHSEEGGEQAHRRKPALGALAAHCTGCGAPAPREATGLASELLCDGNNAKLDSDFASLTETENTSFAEEEEMGSWPSGRVSLVGLLGRIPRLQRLVTPGPLPVHRGVSTVHTPRVSVCMLPEACASPRGPWWGTKGRGWGGACGRALGPPGWQP